MSSFVINFSFALKYISGKWPLDGHKFVQKGCKVEKKKWAFLYTSNQTKQLSFPWSNRNAPPRLQSASPGNAMWYLLEVP